LLAILKLTMDTDQLGLEDLCRAVRMPAAKVRICVEDLAGQGALVLRQHLVSVDVEKRLSIAIMALREGADLERVCRLLSWQEFEEIAVRSLCANGYSVFKHFVFKSNDHRREIDVIGVGQNLVVCLDCKHWMKGIRGTVGEKIAARQIERVQGLVQSAESGSRLGISTRRTLYFVPAIVSLFGTGPRFISQVPIVPVLKLNSFLSSLDPFVEGLFTVCMKGQSELD